MASTKLKLLEAIVDRSFIKVLDMGGSGEDAVGFSCCKFGTTVQNLEHPRCYAALFREPLFPLSWGGDLKKGLKIVVYVCQGIIA